MARDFDDEPGQDQVLFDLAHLYQGTTCCQWAVRLERSQVRLDLGVHDDAPSAISFSVTVRVDSEGYGFSVDGQGVETFTFARAFAVTSR